MPTKQAFQIVACGIIATLFAYYEVSGATVNVPVARDNTIYSANPNNSDGAGADFSIGQSGGTPPSRLRGLLYFDVAALVPAGAIINSATLNLVVSGGASNAPIDRIGSAELHRLTSNWGEGTSNAGTGSMSGNGIAATTNDATWQNNFFNSSTWGTAGGDYVPGSTASFSPISFTPGTLVSFAGLASDVQQWLTEPAANFGWIVIGNEGQTQTVRRFHSREASLAANRPVLTIDFTPVPEPASAALVISAASVWFIIRGVRRRAI